MFDKTKALYVKTAVIQNGVMDTQGDTLNAKEIKQIFTSFNNQNSFEIYHNDIPIEGVSLLENYISTTDEQIGNTIVPAGSWLIVMKVTCPTIQAKVLDKTFNGVSLSNRVKTECSCGLEGIIRYQDLPSAECVIPVFISLVTDGANGVELLVFDYNTYIQKSKGSHKMNLLEELKALIQKAEVTETPVIKKGASEEVDVQEEQSTEQVDETPEEVPEETPEETPEEVPEESEEEVEDKEGEEAEEPEEEAEEEDEPVIKKSCNEEIKKQANDKGPSIEERIAEIEKAVASLIKEDDEKAKDNKKTEEEKKEPVIAKSAKVVITEQNDNKAPDYYEMTGRDPLTGLKIKK